MIKIKPEYGYINYGNRECWHCTTYNVTTTASTKEKCITKHIAKLTTYGFISDEQNVTVESIDNTVKNFCKNPWK